MLGYLKVVIISLMVLVDTTYGDSKFKHLSLSIKLAKMIGRSIKDYIGYGNYCGDGGSGPVLDPIDSCCHEHDNCYHLISLKTGDTCNTIKTDYGIWTDLLSHKLICNDIEFCKREVCQCDTRLEECLQMNDIYYNPLLLDRKKWLKNLSFFMG